MIVQISQAAFFSLIIPFAISLHIRVQPQLFHVNEQKQVSLICSTFNQSKSHLQRMIQLRLRKYADDGTWMDIALLRPDGPTLYSDDNATVHGSVGKMFEYYMKVTWPAAFKHVFGRYRCDGVGYNNIGDIAVDKSIELTVTGVTPEALQLRELLQNSVRNRQVDDKKMVEYLDSKFDKLQEYMDNDILGRIRSVDSKLDRLQEYVDNNTLETVQSMVSKVDILHEYMHNITLKSQDDNITPQEEIFWPKGQIVLPMPYTGCPQNPASWNKGLLKTRMDDMDKFYPLNIPEYVAQPYSLNGWIHLQYCALDESPDRNHSWPRGSFCIHEHYRSILDICPEGFTRSWIRTRTSMTKVIELVPIPAYHNNEDGFFFLSFCCRHDGSPFDPITLPTSFPFYLIRHRGTCQRVKDMSVKQDTIIINTMKERTYDGGFGYRPDSVDGKPYYPVRVRLCFYSKM